MYDLDALFWLILCALGAFYWVNAIRTKEIAHRAAEQHCKLMEVQFLDQTVFLKKLSLKRNALGRMGFMREYYFEFTLSGEDRYIGRVFMQGNRIGSITLDPHRLH
jgi:hypothetical protein